MLDADVVDGRRLKTSYHDSSHPLMLRTYTLTMQNADAIRAGWTASKAAVSHKAFTCKD